MRKIEAHIRKEPESDIVYVKVNKNYKKKLEDGLRNKTSALIKVDKFFYIILALPQLFALPIQFLGKIWLLISEKTSIDGVLLAES